MGIAKYSIFLVPLILYFENTYFSYIQQQFLFEKIESFLKNFATFYTLSITAGCSAVYFSLYFPCSKISPIIRALAGNLKLGGLEIFFSQRVMGRDFLKV